MKVDKEDFSPQNLNGGKSEVWHTFPGVSVRQCPGNLRTPQGVSSGGHSVRIVGYRDRSTGIPWLSYMAGISEPKGQLEK